MKIAITGANGFIGSYLVNRLKRQGKIEFYRFNKKRHSLFDIRSLKSFVEDKDVIIHLAGVKSVLDIAKIYEVNLLGTANLLKAISLFGKKKVHFLFPSSFLVYKENKSKRLLGEKESQISPKTCYGSSKLLAEKIIEFYSINNQIKATILRIANVYGPVLKGKSSSVVNLFIEGIANGTPITVRGNEKTVRDLVYIDDVFDAFLKAIDNQKRKFLLINICTGRATKMGDLIKLIEKRLKKKAIIKYNKKYSEKIYWIGNNLKASREINFRPKIGIEDGIKKTVEWFEKRKAI